MAIDFPSNPTPNQTYTYNNKTWKWNGQGWVVIDANLQPLYDFVSNVNGITGPVGLSGSNSVTITKEGKTLIFTSLGGGIVGNYVEEINGVTGGITLSAGSGISISSSPKLFTVTNTGVRTINGFTGNVGFSAGDGITLIRSGVTFIISALGTPTVEAITSINSMGGPVITIAGGDSIGIASSSNTVTVFNRGVTSINGLTGIVGLSAGRGITLVGSGRTFTIENFGVVSINGITANVGLSAASDNVTIGSVGRTLTISVSGVGGGVSSLNALTGAITATGEGAIIAPIISGQNIIFRTRLGQEWNGVTGATGVNNYRCDHFFVNRNGTVQLRNLTFPIDDDFYEQCIKGIVGDIIESGGDPCYTIVDGQVVDECSSLVWTGDGCDGLLCDFSGCENLSSFCLSNGCRAYDLIIDGQRQCGCFCSNPELF